MRRRVKGSRRREWRLFWALALLVGLQYWVRYYSPWGRLPMPQGTPGTDWFLALRLPEYPNNDVGRAGLEARLEDWLTSMREHGFTPVYLTDALARQARGEDLPEKAVVLLFEASYRPTVENLAPILRRHRFPAFWLTDHDLLDQHDRRVISPHHRAQMRASRKWDLGHFRTSTRTFTLDDPGRVIGDARELRLAWSGTAGSLALNRRGDAPRLTYVNIGLAWTGRQLVERLYAEVPLRGRTPLTAARFFNQQNFGLPVYDPAVERLDRFNIVAPAHARSSWIEWRGTAGMKDVALELDVGLLTGELWVSFRSEGEAGHSVRVGFTEEAIVVESSQWGRQKRAATIPWAKRLRRHLAARVELRGESVRLVVADGPARPAAIVREVPVGGVPAARQGILELLVYGKIRGTAQARSVALTATPLTGDAIKGHLTGGR